MPKTQKTVVEKARDLGLNCQLTRWLPKHEFGFINQCVARLMSDPDRIYKVFSCKMGKEVHFALFVNDVGEHDSYPSQRIGIQNKRVK